LGQCQGGGGDGGGGGGGDVGASGGFACFSSYNTVELHGKGLVSMDSVVIGDHVRTGKNSFSRVYSFGHIDSEKTADYLQIYAEGIEMPLEVTSLHLLFINDKMRPASHVKVGDMLGTNKVSKIRTVTRRGVYAPFTESGEIVVSGFLASSYAAVHSYTPINEHTEAHAFFAFRRLVCAFDFAICENENYTNGYPDWLLPAIRFAMSAEKNPTLQIAATLAGLPIVAVAYTLEQMMYQPLAIGAIILGLVYVITNTKKLMIKD
jgi:hypothetical protein